MAKAINTPFDQLLLPLLSATSADEVDKYKEKLRAELDPMLRQIIFRQLGFRVDHAAKSNNPDAAELYQQINEKIWTHFESLRTNSRETPIEDARSYVARIAYNSCHDYLRRKKDLRSDFSDRLYYVLKATRSFALWKTDDGEQLCGFSEWKNQKVSFLKKRWVSHYKANPKASLQKVLSDIDPGSLSLHELVSRVFGAIRAPLKFGELVDICSNLLQVGGASTIRLYELIEEHLTDSNVDLIAQYENRQSVLHFISQSKSLPVEQRQALFLSLKYAPKRSFLWSLEMLKILTFDQIDELLALPAGLLERIWNDLPEMDDSDVGRFLGKKPEQIRKLRFMARQRLRALEPLVINKI